MRAQYTAAWPPMRFIMNMRRSVIRCKYVFSPGDLPQFYSGSTLHLHDEVSKNKNHIWLYSNWSTPPRVQIDVLSIIVPQWRVTGEKRGPRWNSDFHMTACFLTVDWSPAKPQSGAFNVSFFSTVYLLWSLLCLIFNPVRPFLFALWQMEFGLFFFLGFSLCLCVAADLFPRMFSSLRAPCLVFVLFCFGSLHTSLFYIPLANCMWILCVQSCAKAQSDYSLTKSDCAASLLF